MIINSIDKLNKTKHYINIALVCSDKSKQYLLKEYNQNIPSYIHILDSKENVSDYYNMCDIFVSASRKETFCNAIAEATYMQKVVISSDINGVQWAKELPSVKFFENENAEDLYYKLLETIECIDNNISSKYVKSKKIIESKYTIDSWSDEVIKYYFNSL